MSIKKGDTVKILSGNSKIKGKITTVIKVLPKEQKVILDNINIYKKHLKKKKDSEKDDVVKGGIINKNMPLHISKVMKFDKVLNRPFRVDFKIKK